MIKDNELVMIDKYRRYYVENPKGLNYCEVDYFLRVWKEAKSEYLFKMFGDKLILERPVTYEKSINEIIDEVDNSSEFYCSPFRDNFKQVFGIFGEPSISFSPEIREFISDNRYTINHLIDARSFTENHCKDTLDFPLPNGKKLKITPESKLMRVLSKLASAYNIEGFEEFRILQSQFLNQKSLKGTLCLSIHPLDYMTMSDNDECWSSCMSWTEDGCYKVGTLEMMNSPMVVVAYLKSDNSEFRINNDYWNSKKWRQLFVVNEDIIVGIKAYPYVNEELTSTTAKWLRDIASQVDGFDYVDELCNLKPYGKDFYARTNGMYNDFGCTEHFGYLNAAGREPNFNYSGDAVCPICGQRFIPDEGLETHLICPNCNILHTCEECGEVCDEDDLHEVDGVWMCPSCRDEYAVWCNYDDEYHMADDCLEVYCSPDHSNYYYGRPVYIYKPHISDGNIFHYGRQDLQIYTTEDDVHYIIEAHMSEKNRDYIFNINRYNRPWQRIAEF